MDATLSQEQRVAKKLKEELREDENTREQSLEQFRDWILKHPDIRDCPTDDRLLLAYLRVRKYSVPMAEQSLFNLLKFQHNYPSLNSNLDIEDPDINDVITNGFIFTSPFRDSNDSVMVYFIAKNLDVTKYSYHTTVRGLMLSHLATIHIEQAQIFGTCNILDFGQLPPAYVTFMPVAVVKAVMGALEKAIAIRSKKWHVLNLSPMTTWLVKLIVGAVSEKIQQRFLFHSSLEELHQHVDPSLLPKEYGGTMPMSEMIGLWKKELAVHRDAVLAINNAKLVGDSFKNDLESNDTGIPDMPGSFRKLGVD